MSLEEIDFDLRQTLDSSVGMYVQQAAAKSLALNLAVADSLPNTLSGDPGRLRQVIINLIGNAIKFTDEGVIEVTVDGEQISERELALQISIRDTGIGIPQDQRQAIFEDFLQADSATTRRYGGTGLGLHTSSQLVRMMGGHIELESEEGKGSRFHVSALFRIPDASAAKASITDTIAAPGETAASVTPSLLALDDAVVQDTQHSPPPPKKHQPDWNKILDRLGSDRDLLCELIDVFRGSYSQDLTEIEKAIVEEQPDDLRRSAHKLKGSLATLDMQTALSCAVELEQLGTAGSVDGASEILTRLHLAIDDYIAIQQAFLQQ